MTYGRSSVLSPSALALLGAVSLASLVALHHRRKRDGEASSDVNAAPSITTRPSRPSAKKLAAAAPAPTPPAKSSAPIFIGYGSQTGNAKAIAQDIFEQLTEAKLDPKLFPLDAWKTVTPPPLSAPGAFLIVVVSTYGNGGAPQNAEKFTRFVKRLSHPSDLLASLRYTVLAIGDIHYLKFGNFCNMGKLLDGRFAELGATRVYPLGCADDATGLEDVVRPWRAGLVPALKLAMNMAMKGSDETGAGEAKGSEVSNKAVPWPLYDHSALEESLQPLRGLWG